MKEFSFLDDRISFFGYQNFPFLDVNFLFWVEKFPFLDIKIFFLDAKNFLF